jgi:riboflavin kinase / FMN adenylyltransferase
MEVRHDALRNADVPYGAVATIGNYDGIHRGQLAVIGRTVERARAEGVQAAVITFDPHPVSVLRPEVAPALLTPAKQREELLAEAGVDVMLVVRFDQDFAATSADDFVRRFLHEELKVKAVYVGERFMFGRDREGDVERLRELGAELGFEAVGVEEVVCQGAPISSTRIRQAIEDGKVDLAMELLGRSYSLRGTIARGDRMGARLGWPTINLLTDNELVPCNGVYSGRVHLPSFPGTFDCVTNVGTRPTVYENHQRVVESHILGFSANIYGEPAEVHFYKRLREEMIFSTVMDLSAQIGRDVEATREYFAVRRRLEECAESG